MLKVIIIGLVRCELECPAMSVDDVLLQLDTRAPLAVAFELVGAGQGCVCVRAYLPGAV